MDSELLLKFIGYFPDYLSALSRTLFVFFLFLDYLCRNNCIQWGNQIYAGVVHRILINISVSSHNRNTVNNSYFIRSVQKRTSKLK